MTNTEQTAGSIERRHDLDALRAFAMLLGIVLHGALAFIPGAWAVSDASVEGDGTPYAILVTAIHGFRMPVFFLMSGFFTAMLWRQRGLQALVRHRARRVLLPLVIAMIVVIPLSWAAWGYAESVTSDEDGDVVEMEAVPEDDVWKAASRGDVAALERHAADGAPVDVPDPALGTTPLGWTALHGHVDAAKWLLDNGAGVNTLNGDGSTALHSAAFMGRAEVVRLMLERGADPHARHPNGALPIHSSRADPATTAYYVGLLGLTYDEAALDAGRAEVGQLLTEAMERPRATDSAAAGTDEEAGVAEARTDAAGGVAPYRGDPDASLHEERALLVPWYWDALYAYEWGGLFTYDVFSHLWFLWYLVWLVVAFALVVWVAARLGLRLSWLPDRLVVTPALYLWAVPVTMAAQYFMGVEGHFAEFGADTFTGVLPAPHVLAYYAIFFGFGAVYFGRNEGGARIGRWWQLTLPLALVVLLAGLVLTFPEEGGTAQGGARWGSLFLQAAYAWMMTLGLTGLFQAVLGAGNARVRYLSDASYWLYVMHLPLIIALQGVSFEWALPSVVKLVLLIAVTSGVLLVVYEWGVRYTPVGTLLNGRRRRVSSAEG